MRRVSIRKIGERWVTTRPGYGFGQPTTTEYPTWKAAMRSLAPRLGTSGVWLDRRPQVTYDSQPTAY